MGQSSQPGTANLVLFGTYLYLNTMCCHCVLALHLLRLLLVSQSMEILELAGRANSIGVTAVGADGPRVPPARTGYPPQPP
jgi:hypothetical protein